MSRIHRRGTRRSWDLEAVRETTVTGWGAHLVMPAPARFLLSMTLGDDRDRELMAGVLGRQYRGSPFFEYSNGPGVTRVGGIEVTEAEARRITSGEDPLDVLTGEFPACGYRLFAVADPLLQGAGA